MTGVVTAAYPTGGFNGFVIQTAGTGGTVDLATHTASDALFVFSAGTGAVDAVAVGDYVAVTGWSSEYFGLTEITPSEAADVVAAEQDGHEGHRVHDGGVAGHGRRSGRAWSRCCTCRRARTRSPTPSATNQYGEVGLAFGSTPLIQPTEVARPGTAAGRRGHGRQRRPRGHSRRRRDRPTS